MSTSSTKIRIAFARQDCRAVILRQGPGKWTQMLTWCTRTNELVPGQWIKAHVPHFSANSDASLILCFVQSYRRGQEFDTWVSLSRPPWFTALTTWAVGDSWGGRCSFLSDSTIYVGEGLSPLVQHGVLDRKMRWVSDPSQGPKNAESGACWPNQETRWHCPSIGELLVKRQRHGVDWAISVWKSSRPKRREPTRRARPELIAELNNVFFSQVTPSGKFLFTRRDGTISQLDWVDGALQSTKIFDLSAASPERIQAPTSATQW